MSKEYTATGIETIETATGLYYLLDGDFHKDNGPAVEYNVGTYGWYHRGVHCANIHHYCSLANISKEDKLILLLKYGE